MKIEAGKYYRTQDGKKAFVGHKTPFTLIPGFPYRGEINEKSHMSWTLEGVSRERNNYDLVEEWKDPPPTFNITVCLSDPSHGGKYEVFAYFSDNSQRMMYKASATKQITLTKGEFADEN